MSDLPKAVRLYDFQDAPNPRRTRGFLVEKGISLPLVSIDLMAGEHRTKPFLAMNPLGQVPVLELEDGSHIAESIAICRYLEHIYPTPSLFGADARIRARVEMWNRRIEFELLRTIGDVADHTDPLFADRIEQNAAYAAIQRRAAASKWLWLDSMLSDRRQYIAGDIFSIADLTAMAASWLSEQLEIPLPAGAKHLRGWDERMRARASWSA